MGANLPAILDVMANRVHFKFASIGLVTATYCHRRPEAAGRTRNGALAAAAECHRP